MITNTRITIRQASLAGIAAAACLLLLPALDTITAGPDLGSAAYADQGQGSGQGRGHGAGGPGGPDAEHGAATHPGTGGKGAGRGGAGAGGAGAGGGHVPTGVPGEAEDDSDKRGPKYAGGKDPGRPSGAGTKKGDVYGDLWVILRDVNGVPILKEIVDEKGNVSYVVQPLDADGNLVPLDEEGSPIDESLVVTVDLARLNVGRSPPNVLDRQLTELVANLEKATAITVDVAGRLVYTVDGVTQTVDSPLANLALYVRLLTTGSLDFDTALDLGSLSYLNDGKLTTADLSAAAAFLAASGDKTLPISTDLVAYTNAVLGVEGTLTDLNDRTYVDYSSFSYDRSDTYAGVTVDVMVQQPDGTWKVETVNVYDTVFGGTDYTGTNIDAFQTAADDVRTVIDFVHENAPPATE